MPKIDKTTKLVQEVADDLVKRVAEIVTKFCRKYTSTMDIWSDKLGFNSCLGKNSVTHIDIFNKSVLKG